jgi:hypothetical protein
MNDPEVTMPRRGANNTLDGFDQVRAMTWRLLNPKT